MLYFFFFHITYHLKFYPVICLWYLSILFIENKHPLLDDKSHKHEDIADVFSVLRTVPKQSGHLKVFITVDMIFWYKSH